MHASFKTRVIFLCSILVVGLSVLSGRLVQIQLMSRHCYVVNSRKPLPRTETLPAPRGMIVDRHEKTLAKSITVTTVFADKNHLLDPKIASYGIAYQAASEDPKWNELDAAAQRRSINRVRGKILSKEESEAIIRKHLAYAVGVLARPLGQRREELREKIESSKDKLVAIAKDLPEDAADRLREAVENNWIQGIVFQNSIKRWYPTPNLATHLVGFTGEVVNEQGKPEIMGIGHFGVEYAMETYLVGRDGWRDHDRDARGLAKPGDSDSLSPPQAGRNVQLTIDIGLQAIVEKELDAGLDEFDSKSGAVVLMDPNNGEVLALASRPNFDLNHKGESVTNGWNYAIQSMYEPGSTIKIVATSGALNEGLVTPNSSVNCFNGCYKSGHVEVRDKHPAGILTFEGVLQKSNNNGTCNLGRQLGAKRFYDYLHRYGFGRETGIQLSGERAGGARNTGNEVDFSRACFGYATSVTPLQLACAYSVIASDGKLRKPHIIKAIVRNDGTVAEEFPPEVVNEVIKPQTAAKMRIALGKVVLPGGTATLAAVPGFHVAGKTGTVLKHNPKGGYYGNKYIVSFVGMMPAEKPAFVCLVVLDDPGKPQGRILGGLIAAPIFSRIAARAAVYMNLQPTEPVAHPLATATDR